MSKEVRCIMFSADDTHAAVASFLGRKMKGLDPYAVERVELSSQDGAVSASVGLSGERAGDAPTLDSNEVMAAMRTAARGGSRSRTARPRRSSCRRGVWCSSWQ